jgi:hypothetical protein
MSNIFAIFLQSLAIKLGTVSALNLAQACHAFLPRWMNYILYVFAEAAIIATDIAEVSHFAFRVFVPVDQTGDWFCYCIKPSDPRDATGSRMCHFHYRCYGPPYFLPSGRINKRLTVF